MKRVAAYRKQYPPFAPPLDYGKDNPMKEEFEKYAQDVEAITAEVLKSMGSRRITTGSCGRRGQRAIFPDTFVAAPHTWNVRAR